MQIKTIYHYTTVRMAKIWNTNTTKYSPTGIFIFDGSAKCYSHFTLSVSYKTMHTVYNMVLSSVLNDALHGNETSVNDYLDWTLIPMHSRHVDWMNEKY